MRGSYSASQTVFTTNEMLIITSSYPHALHHLDLLQNAQFRAEIGKDEWREYLNQKQYDHWRTWFAIYPLRTSELQ